MAIKVYGLAAATCTKRVLATLKEKQLDYELIVVNLASGEHKQAPYIEKQPFGVIPVLEDGEFTIYESRAICRYLENKYKTSGNQLIPTNPEELGLFEQGASIETSYWDPNASGIIFEKFFKALKGLGEADEARVKVASEKLAQYLDVYEKILSKQEYIGGNQFTLADLFHLPYGSLLFVPQVNFGHLLLERPHVKTWWEKITSRPAWQEVA